MNKKITINMFNILFLFLLLSTFAFAEYVGTYGRQDFRESGWDNFWTFFFYFLDYIPYILILLLIFWGINKFKKRLGGK